MISHFFGLLFILGNTADSNSLQGNQISAAAPTCQCTQSNNLTSDLMLEQLRYKRAQLDRREKALEIAEKNIDTRIEQLKKAVDNLEAKVFVQLVQKPDFASRIATLYQMVDQLPPKKAATILENTDADLVANLMAMMPTERSSLLLQQMPPKKAAKIIEQVGILKSSNTNNQNKP